MAAVPSATLAGSSRVRPSGQERISAGPAPVGMAWWRSTCLASHRCLPAATARWFLRAPRRTGTSPWTVFDAMLATPYDSDAAFTASGATEDGFLDTWASGVSRTRGANGQAGRRTVPGRRQEKAPTVRANIEDDTDLPLAAPRAPRGFPDQRRCGHHDPRLRRTRPDYQRRRRYPGDPDAIPVHEPKPDALHLPEGLYLRRADRLPGDGSTWVRLWSRTARRKFAAVL